MRALALLMLSCAGAVDPGADTSISVAPGECVLVYRYDSRVEMVVDGVRRKELCLAFSADGYLPVRVSDCSVLVSNVVPCSCGTL